MTTKKEDREVAVEVVINSRGEPDVIWLQVHGDEDPADYDEPADVQNSEVTWCWEQLFDHDVKYIRADLAATNQQECEDRAESVYRHLMRVAPWSESNDMTWADEMICGIDLMKQDLADAEKRAEAAEAMAGEPGLLRLLVDLRFALGDNGKRMQDELLEFARELTEDAERYRWLRRMAEEQLLKPKAARSECPDMRTHWRIPTLICSGPVGGFIDFDSAIDNAMQCDKD